MLRSLLSQIHSNTSLNPDGNIGNFAAQLTKKMEEVQHLKETNSYLADVIQISEAKKVDHQPERNFQINRQTSSEQRVSSDSRSEDDEKNYLREHIPSVAELPNSKTLEDSKQLEDAQEALLKACFKIQELEKLLAVPRQPTQTMSVLSSKLKQLEVEKNQLKRENLKISRQMVEMNLQLIDLQTRNHELSEKVESVGEAMECVDGLEDVDQSEEVADPLSKFSY